jgi:hypothetical protein
MQLEITAVNSDVTLGGDEQFVAVDTALGPVVVTLPLAAGNHGEAMIIKHVSGVGACTLARGGSDLIDGKKSVSLNALNRFVHVVADENSSAWYVIGND